MSEFIKKYIIKQFASAKPIKVKGFDLSLELSVEAGKVELSVLDGDDKQGQKSLLVVVMLLANGQEIQMYCAPAPVNFSQAETLFKLLELQ